MVWAEGLHISSILFSIQVENILMRDTSERDKWTRLVGCSGGWLERFLDDWLVVKYTVGCLVGWFVGCRDLSDGWSVV